MLLGEGDLVGSIFDGNGFPGAPRAGQNIFPGGSNNGGKELWPACDRATENYANGLDGRLGLIVETRF